jgi:predicted DNA-binding protein
MGRPPLGVKSTNVRLSDGLAGRIDALVGPNRRAAFIREVVKREVERLEKVRAEKGDKRLP